MCQEPAARRGFVTQLQREYLDYVLTEGEVLSVPASESDEQPLDGDGQRRLYFQLVHKTTALQKKMRTAPGARGHRMSYPASVQRLQSWSPAGVVLGQGERLLVHDGDPEVLDLLEWVKWESWETGLVQWKQVRSAHDGCSAVEGGQPVQVIVDGSDS